MQFQNTIAYAQFYTAGGSVTPVADDWVEFGYDADEVSGLVKNIHSGGASGEYAFEVQQDGDYFYDISFVAGGGDSKTYTIRTLINNVVSSNIEQFQFFQQNTDQKYEVSQNNIINLSRGDVVKWQVYVPSVSATTFTLNDIKLCVYSLQQLGSH
jgi:hypothetical protein